MKRYTFIYLMKNLEGVKAEYDESLYPFFNNPKQRVKIRSIWRNNIYSIKAQQFQKDFIWEYLNGYIEEEIENDILY